MRRIARESLRDRARAPGGSDQSWDDRPATSPATAEAGEAAPEPPLASIFRDIFRHYFDKAVKQSLVIDDVPRVEEAVSAGSQCHEPQVARGFRRAPSLGGVVTASRQGPTDRDTRQSLADTSRG